MNDILIAPDAYDRLVENYVRIARENAELREENNNLIKAVDNLDSANKKISNELNDIRWEFMRYQEQIKKLTELNVSVEVE
jgi:uncharacterized protein YlxW (UPF0749 family)